MNPEIFLHPIKTTRTPSGRFEVVEDLLALEGGARVFSYISIRNGACILPFYKEKLVLLYEYRYPIQTYTWSLPGGILEAGEDPAAAAGRELQEETGFIPGEIHPLGSVYTSFGSSDEQIHLFWTECTARGQDHLDDAEFLEVHLKTIPEFCEMIRSGAFMHGAGLAAWAQFVSAYPEKIPHTARQ
ncbi:MAG: NUDIX hydrolase [Eubacterium sp.]|nr:NUDIX hydrolase [Eubacterium sp.]